VNSNGTDGSAALDLVIALLIAWRDEDEPMVEAIANTLAEYQRTDSQERARRVLDTVIGVLGRHAEAMRPECGHPTNGSPRLFSYASRSNSVVGAQVPSPRGKVPTDSNPGRAPNGGQRRLAAKFRRLRTGV